MTRLPAVANSELDTLDGTSDNASNPPSTPRPRNGNVNKDLPLAPDEIAGLREQKRQYTKDLLAEAHAQDKKPDIDPNHAYPNFEESTTLHLSETPFYKFRANTRYQLAWSLI
jgi:hypothetical protein